MLLHTLLGLSTARIRRLFSPSFFTHCIATHSVTSPSLSTLCLLSALSLSTSVAAESDKPVDNKHKLPLDELYLFTEVYHQIRYNYVNEVSDRELIDLAIKGMLEGLDPHSAYLDQNAYKELRESTQGEFAGIGVEVSLANGAITVITPIDDSPAAKAGIQPGDTITAIDGIAVNPNNLEASVERMRGKKGSSVKLKLKRKDSDKPITLSLTRDLIKIVSAKGEFIDKGIVYLRISQFQNTTADETSKILKKAANSNPKGLLIDLRNNPGGVLTGAVDVADLLLDDTLIVYTQGKDKDTREDYLGTTFQLFKDLPVVVLVNEGSASAAEILAGALQDNQRAITVGTKTFGKGSVQTILGLPQEKAMKLTTAKYFTPSGRSIQLQGIIPDITIKQGKLDVDKSKHVKEADLHNRLNNKNAKPTTLVASNALLRDDYQLSQAFNILKAITLQHK